MGKNGKQLPILYTIWVQETKANGTKDLIKRTKVAFKNEYEAKLYRDYLNKSNLMPSDFKYVVVKEESVLYNKALDLITNPDEYSILID